MQGEAGVPSEILLQILASLCYSSDATPSPILEIATQSNSKQLQLFSKMFFLVEIVDIDQRQSFEIAGPGIIYHSVSRCKKGYDQASIWNPSGHDLTVPLIKLLMIYQ